MIMKNKFAIIIISLLVLSGCDDDWLDTKPLSIYTPESVYVDKAGMDAQLLNLRKGLRFEYVGERQLMLLEYYASDLGASADKQVTTISDWEIVRPTGTGGLHKLFNYWDNAYRLIRDANIVISRIDNPEWNSEKDKNEILAEAYFHRAYWYYRLVHQFGDVPFLNQEYTKPKIDFYTHSRRTILDKIQEDLEFAVQWLPENVDPGKINRAAGNHLLTKVYLTNSEFDKAIKSASDVIDGGSYSLMDQRFGAVAGDNHFNVIWDLHQRENKSIAENSEKILVAQDKYGFGDASSGSRASSMMRNWTPWWSRNLYIKDPDGKPGCTDQPGEPQVIALGRGTGFIRSTNYFLYEIWENCEDDLRHDTDTNWYSTTKLRYNNPNSIFYGELVDINYSNLIDTFKAYYDWPYYKIYVKDENRPTQPWGGNTDLYIFRLAGTYLLRAEAYYWKGKFTKAAEDLNKVRERAKAPLINASDVSLEYILDERARELYIEEPRKTELTRIAFMLAENNLMGYSLANFSEKNFWFDRVQEKNFYNKGYFWGPYEHKISPFNVLWPIPQDAIDSNAGGHINQNIGYTGAENNIPSKTSISEED